MSPVQAFYEATKRLLHLLESNKPDGRDERIVLIEELLSERESLIRKIQSPYSDEEKELGKQLIQLNQKVTALLTREKTAIQKDLKQLNVKKESTNKYINPYQSLSTDGMFYDKRK